MIKSSLKVARGATLICLLSLAASLPALAEAPVKFDMAKSKYKPGQVWSYKTRPEDKDSTLKVLMVEEYDKSGKVIHITVTKLKVKNPKSPTGFNESIEHAPITEKALDASTVKKLADEPAPEKPKGYDIWKTEFDKGKATIFAVPVIEIVETISGPLANKAGKSPDKAANDASKKKIFIKDVKVKKPEDVKKEAK